MNLLIIEQKKNELIFATFHRKRNELSFVEATRHPLGNGDSIPLLVQDFACSKKRGAESNPGNSVPTAVPA